MTQVMPARQRGAGQCLHEGRRVRGGGEQGSLAFGPGAQAVEPVQQSGDDLDVAPAAERGVNVIEEAGPEAARLYGPPGERVDTGSGQPVPGRGGQACADPAG